VVPRRPENTGTCKLHRTVAEALHDVVAEAERAAFMGAGNGRTSSEKATYSWVLPR
jgi:hypothetical protein